MLNHVLCFIFYLSFEKFSIAYYVAYYLLAMAMMAKLFFLIFNI